MGAFVGIRLLLGLTRSGLALLRWRGMNPVGRLIHVQLAGDLICSRLELLYSLAQPSSDFRDTLGAKDEQNGQEY